MLSAIVKVLKCPVADWCENFWLVELAVRPVKDLPGVAFGRFIAGLLDHACCEIFQVIREYHAVFNGIFIAFAKHVAGVLG